MEGFRSRAEHAMHAVALIRRARVVEKTANPPLNIRIPAALDRELATMYLERASLTRLGKWQRKKAADSYLSLVRHLHSVNYPVKCLAKEYSDRAWFLRKGADIPKLLGLE